jgi:hypothetical protein
VALFWLKDGRGICGGCRAILKIPATLIEICDSETAAVKVCAPLCKRCGGRGRERALRKSCRRIAMRLDALAGRN